VTTVPLDTVQFLPMDVTAIVSVVSSATVALTTLGVNAFTRRGDRKHEARLDYQQRIWEDKRAALVAVMGDCDVIRSTCSKRQVGPPDMPTDVYRRIEVLLTVESLRSRLSAQRGPLVAYADKSVWELFETLTNIIDSQTEEHWADLFVLENIRHQRKSAADRDDFAEHVRIRREESETQREVGERCTLDVDALRALCASIIDTARRDLGP
jgi:hypothetical protein